MEINYDQSTSDDINYAHSIRISDDRLAINLYCANPDITEFVCVPKEALSNVLNTDKSLLKFDLTSNEMSQIKKLFKLDTLDEFSFGLLDTVVAKSSDYKYNLSGEYELLSDNNEANFSMDKELFNKIEDAEYTAYAMNDKIILHSKDDKIINVVSLTKKVDE